MTYEEKKKFLSGYRNAMYRIAGLAEERQKWHDLSNKVTQNLSVAPGGGGTADKIGTAAAEIADIDHQILLEIRAAREIRKNIRDVIESIPNNRHRTVLKMVYMSGMSFAKVSCVLGKSERNVQDIHKKALNGLKI